MNLIQNEDNKCPTTKQVNDALESMGGVQTLVLTTPNLIDESRDTILEISSTDQEVMEIVKSNMTNLEPFQLWCCGTIGTVPICAPVAIYGIPYANMFMLYVYVSSTGIRHFSIIKDDGTQKWTASTLNT